MGIQEYRIYRVSYAMVKCVAYFLFPLSCLSSFLSDSILHSNAHIRLHPISVCVSPILIFQNPYPHAILVVEVMLPIKCPLCIDRYKNSLIMKRQCLICKHVLLNSSSLIFFFFRFFPLSNGIDDMEQRSLLFFSFFIIKDLFLFLFIDREKRLVASGLVIHRV